MNRDLSKFEPPKVNVIPGAAYIQSSKGGIYMNANEAIVIISEDEDEWYSHYQTCSVCGTDFMCSNAKVCPGCGRKIIGSKHGNETVFYGKGDE